MNPEHCIRWAGDEIVSLYEWANLTIFLAYLFISANITYIKVKRPDVIDSWIAVTFTMFIFLCGVTHLLAFLSINYDIYESLTVEYAVTAAVSAMTAFGLLWQTKMFLHTAPSPERYRQALQEKIRAEWESTEANRLLREYNDALQKQILELESGKKNLSNGGFLAILQDLEQLTNDERRESTGNHQ